MIHIEGYMTMGIMMEEALAEETQGVGILRRMFIGQMVKEQICTHNKTSKSDNSLYQTPAASTSKGKRGGTGWGGAFSTSCWRHSQILRLSAPARGRERARGRGRGEIRRLLARVLSWFMILVLFWYMIHHIWYGVCDMNVIWREYECNMNLIWNWDMKLFYEILRNK